ncbi:hypothetical protein PPL_12219 [Heterostelium album PN500]|uniref:NUC153 domain-containing protein n=1 Tax=Heterostelium pallidum (strain ATCC 26659 / Pp 5 / PN500) TaxID=670386 RepID=D3BM11_HETP5|nr:hypothetical protein PPL_12219 [Heterostelium album PN500]EFA77612.1 hypothetical protein PPL_12219 [Heterostelium album PN500]|eukprot:XP_020429740.1 hypothetical protein PPL_12219 [Heterostelium album PN500]
MSSNNNNKKNNNNKIKPNGKAFVQQNDVIKDNRFKRAQNDPKFKLIKKKDSAIELDSRFSDVIKSGRFDDEAPVDQFGRKNLKYDKNQQKFNKEQFKNAPKSTKQQQQNNKTATNDSRFAIPEKWNKFQEDGEKDDDEEDEDEEVVEQVAPKSKKQQTVQKKEVAVSTKQSNKKKQVEEEEEEEEKDSEDDSEIEEEEVDDDGNTEVKEITYGGFEYNEDTESSDEDNYDDVLDQVDEDEIAQEEDIPRGDATKRLAILNCDWENMQSKDLFIVLNSFVPKDGALLSITIYPSDFGLKQMEIEKRLGPSKDIFRDSTKVNLDETDIQYDTKEDAEALDGRGFNLTSLRKYELDKLKYYYGVAVFDSAESASKVYEECDGLDIEDTANSMDLRFVPDEQEFTNPPRDSCTEAPDAPPNLNFTTTVLKGTSVDFTWDVDKNRKKALTKNFNSGDYDEDEIKIYLADPESSEEDESDQERNKNEKAKLRNQYRSLLLGNDDDDDNDNQDSEKSEGLKVTFKSGLESDDEEDDGLKVEFSDGEVESSGSEGGQDDSDDESGGDSDDESGESDSEQDNQIDPQDEEWTKQMMDKDSDDDETAQEITIKTDLHKVGQNLLKEKEKRESGTTWSDYLEKRQTKQNEKMKAKRLKAQEEEKKREEESKKGRKNKKPTEQELKSKAELELLMMDEDKDKGYNKKMLERQVKENTSTNKKKNNKKKNEPEGGDSFKIDTKDSRFERLYNQADFAMDPTDPKFKLTNAVKGILEEKKRRRADRDQNNNNNNKPNNANNKQKAVLEEKQVEKKVKTEHNSFQQMAANIKKKAELQKSKKLK